MSHNAIGLLQANGQVEEYGNNGGKDDAIIVAITTDDETTFAAKFQSLYSAFASLTDDQKERSYIVQNNGSCFPYNGSDSYASSRLTTGGSGDYFTSSTIKMVDNACTLKRMMIRPNNEPPITIEDRSSSTSSGIFALKVI